MRKGTGGRLEAWVLEAALAVVELAPPWPLVPAPDAPAEEDSVPPLWALLGAPDAPSLLADAAPAEDPAEAGADPPDAAAALEAPPAEEEMAAEVAGAALEGGALCPEDGREEVPAVEVAGAALVAREDAPEEPPPDEPTPLEPPPLEPPPLEPPLLELPDSSSGPGVHATGRTTAPATSHNPSPTGHTPRMLPPDV